MEFEQLKPIKKEKISEAVFNQLLQLIKSGQWQSGYKLPSENKLCSLFDVSRVSVRAALHKLEAIGLIETRNGEGTFVKKADMRSLLEPVMETMTLTPTDIIDILEFRKLIERSCAQQMAAYHKPEDLNELSHCLKKMQTFSGAGDAMNYSIWDARFHQRIVASSGNHITITVYSLIFESIYAHLCSMNRQIGFDLGMFHHEKIFQAIASGDPETASACVVQSIDDSIGKVKAVMLAHP